MDIHWMTAFIDRPAATREIAVNFWRAVTHSSLSTARGDEDQYATLLPPDPSHGAYLKVQRVDTPRGVHLDFHVSDVAVASAHAQSLGAEQVQDGTYRVMRSPAGFVFCFVSHRAVGARPTPVVTAGVANLIDQVAIDVPHELFTHECEFWASMTGWELRTGAFTEFAFLARPEGLPLRILLQRLGADDVRSTATGHLDIACGSGTGDVAEEHVLLGASIESRGVRWISMSDPSGVPYCLTERNPLTGRPPLGERFEMNSSGLVFVEGDPQRSPLDDEERAIAAEATRRGLEIRTVSSRQIRSVAIATEARLVAGSVAFVEQALRKGGYEVPKANDYPTELGGHYRRDFFVTTIRSIRQQMEDGRRPLFVKPLERRKRFPGMVLHGPEDLWRLANVGDNVKVVSSEVVPFLSEWRAFVIDGDVVGLRHYEGDPSVLVDESVVQSVVSTYVASKGSFAGCAIDFGVSAKSGTTLVVEVNDGFALGRYGLDENLYFDLVEARWLQLTHNRLAH